MSATTDKTEHTGSIGCIDGFTKDLFPDNDNGIGRNDEFVWGETGPIGICFLA